MKNHHLVNVAANYCRASHAGTDGRRTLEFYGSRELSLVRLSV